MQTAGIARLATYPEFRGCAPPTADRIFEIFTHLQQHELYDQAAPWSRSSGPNSPRYS
jgi:hypothetical protein